MSNIDKLVAEFLKGTCSAEQADLLAQYFSEHPEEVEKYFSEAEWNSFQPETLMPVNVAEEVWQNITQHFPSEQKKKKRFSMKQLLVAAGLLLLPVTGWLFYQLNTSAVTHVQNDLSIAKINVINNGEYLKLITLSDGSVVTLEKGASISYDSVFSSRERRVFLNEGRVLFAVAGNPEHPFVVQTKDITTTALGTEFYVDHKVKEEKILVQLLEGKVALRSENEKVIMTEILLKPGQQCFIDQRTMEATLSNFKVITLNTEEQKNTPKHAKTAVKKVTPIAWDYYKKPLDQLLDELSGYYQFNIEYNKDIMHQVHFTGNLMKADSLRKNIAIVCIASGLEFEYLEGKLIIRKKKAEQE
ncbi:FecR family protein [Gynurincola endophyticus]|uniref:FecR family protein n=1 Tax=Gynurincola endophyticus TaxID=2479004 RepID=UPI000F8CC178|nr:FecR family protein [Gynurincola endophyticus]